MLRLCFPLAIEWPATTSVEISVLSSNCQLWFTPLTLCTNDCNKQTLPAASSWLISLNLYTSGGFPYCWRMPINSLGKSKLISWPNKTNDTQPTICHGLERWNPTGSLCCTNEVLAIFGFATVATFSLWLCAIKMQKHQQLSNLELQWPTLYCNSWVLSLATM